MAGSETATFNNSLDQVFSSAQKAIRDLGYKVDSLDKNNGLLNFKTGLSWWSWAGQEMSVMMIDNGNSSIEVSVSGRRNQSGVVLQITDFGEAGGIARKVIAKMAEHLPLYSNDDSNSKVDDDDCEVVRFKCGDCRERLAWAACDAGKKILCTSCGAVNRVPDIEGNTKQVPATNHRPTPNSRLRDCPDCDSQVSKRATQCPKCGCPLDPSA